MAKKEMRRAARQAQQAKISGPRKPTWRRAAIQGVVLTGLYVLITQVILRSEWPDTAQGIALYVGMMLLFFVMYTVFVYYWENLLFRRRERKRQAGGR